MPGSICFLFKYFASFCYFYYIYLQFFFYLIVDSTANKEDYYGIVVSAAHDEWCCLGIEQSYVCIDVQEVDEIQTKSDQI